MTIKVCNCGLPRSENGPHAESCPMFEPPYGVRDGQIWRSPAGDYEIEIVSFGGVHEGGSIWNVLQKWTHAPYAPATPTQFFEQTIQRRLILCETPVPAAGHADDGTKVQDALRNDRLYKRRVFAAADDIMGAVDEVLTRNALRGYIEKRKPEGTTIDACLVDALGDNVTVQDVIVNRLAIQDLEERLAHAFFDVEMLREAERIAERNTIAGDVQKGPGSHVTHPAADPVEAFYDRTGETRRVLDLMWRMHGCKECGGVLNAGALGIRCPAFGREHSFVARAAGRPHVRSACEAKAKEILEAMRRRV